MAGKAETSKTLPVPAVGELQQIHSAYRLNGKNYLKWSQLVRTTLKGKGKLSHLLGSGPNKKDPKFAAWDEEDSLIMAWLWNSMMPDISDTCMFLTTAKEIWDSIRQTYSKKGDAAQIYEIKVQTGLATQRNKSVTAYASTLKNLWQEIYHYRCFETKCPDDATILKNYIEQDRVYDFLVGLNPEFDQVRVQILGRDQIPSLNDDATILKNYIEQDRVYDFLVGFNPEFDQVRVQILGRDQIPSLNEVIAIIRSEESRCHA
ncbi:uncharacterized protein [Henckelia pumila]|uniref:uncharacterized protein n=1 Tax=Henckelia pumila TaxID=405737 RepID=UPI003C6E27A4